MLPGRSAALTISLLILGIATTLPACAQKEPRIPSLDDYPPAIVQHLLADFAAQQKALADTGVPTTIDALATWNSCVDDQQNAYKLYEKAFETTTRSDCLRLLRDAAELPCYQYPFDVKKLKHPTRKYDTLDIDFMSGMRETSRVISNEIVIQTASGNTELAVHNAEVACAMLGHLSKLPMIIHQLSRYACQGLVLESIGDLLCDPSLTEAQLTRLDHALAGAMDPKVLARVWTVEKLIFEDEDPFDSTPTIHVIDARNRALLLAARSVVALERHQLATGALPATLADLVPAYLPEVPVDPFTDGPMSYAVGADYYGVFSVDSDGEPCANPLEITDGSERTLVRVPVVKKTRPLSEMSYAPTRGDGKENSRAEKKAMENVASIALEGIPDKTSGAVMLSAGPLDGGIAVMLNALSYSDRDVPVKPVLAAFWINRGTIYTVNAWARDLAPDLAQAPDAITFDRVMDVVH